jgi:hypothetical protein
MISIQISGEDPDEIRAILESLYKPLPEEKHPLPGKTPDVPGLAAVLQKEPMPAEIQPKSISKPSGILKIPHTEDQFILQQREKGLKFIEIASDLKAKGIDCNEKDTTNRFYHLQKKQQKEKPLELLQAESSPVPSSQNQPIVKPENVAQRIPTHEKPIVKPENVAQRIPTHEKPIVKPENVAQRIPTHEKPIVKPENVAQRIPTHENVQPVQPVQPARSASNILTDKKIDSLILDMADGGATNYEIARRIEHDYSRMFTVMEIGTMIRGFRQQGLI